MPRIPIREENETVETWGKLEQMLKGEKETTTADYDRAFTLSELKNMCREKGLSTSGDKKALIIRLIAFLYQKGEIKIKLEGGRTISRYV